MYQKQRKFRCFLSKFEQFGEFFVNIERQKSFLIKTLYAVTVAMLIYFSLKLLLGPLFPFAAAAVLTVSLQRFIRKYSKKLRLKKKAASVAIIIFVYFIVGALLFWLVYALYRQLISFVQNLPEYSGYFSDAISKIADKFNSIMDTMPDFAGNLLGEMPQATLETITTNVASYLTQLAGNIASGIPYFLLSIVVMIISSAYFAKDYDDICGFFVGVIPKPTLKKLIFIKRTVLGNFLKMIKGYLTIMAISFGEIFLGLLFLKVKYALIIAAVTSVVDILPVLGSGTVLIPWALFSALSGNTSRAIGLVIIYLIITAVRNIIEPKIIGSKVGVHPLIMLAAVFIGLSIFGTSGIVLMPVAVIVIKSWLESVYKLKQQNSNNDTSKSSS